MNRELSEMIRKYALLRFLSPKNELLKYFFWDESGFERNSDKKIVDEFIDKFRGDFPTVKEILSKKIKITYSEYIKKLSSSLFKNYASALERTINFFEITN